MLPTPTTRGRCPAGESPPSGARTRTHGTGPSTPHAAHTTQHSRGHQQGVDVTSAVSSCIPDLVAWVQQQFSCTVKKIEWDRAYASGMPFLRVSSTLRYCSAAMDYHSNHVVIVINVRTKQWHEKCYAQRCLGVRPQLHSLPPALNTHLTLASAPPHNSVHRPFLAWLHSWLHRHQ